MNHNVSSVVSHGLLTYEYRLYFELTIELQLNHFDFVVAAVSVDVFQHDSVVIPPLVGISFRHTTANTQVPTNGSCVHAEVQRCICSLWKLELREQAVFDSHGEGSCISSASWVHAKLTYANAGCL